MAHYAVKIVRRRKPGETRGLVVETIEFDAYGDEAAQHHALTLVEGLDWAANFAALEGAPGDIRAFWMNKPHA